MKTQTPEKSNRSVNRSGNRSNDRAERTIKKRPMLNRSIVGGEGLSSSLRSRSAGSPNDRQNPWGTMAYVAGWGNRSVNRSGNRSVVFWGSRDPHVSRVLIVRSVTPLEETNDQLGGGARRGVWPGLRRLGGGFAFERTDAIMKNMTAQIKPKTGGGHLRKYDRAAVCEHVCAELKAGRSLESICKDAGMPHVATFLEWVKQDPAGIGKDYAHAREIGYALLADEIIAIADKTHEWVTIQEQDSDGRPLFDAEGVPRLKQVLMPLNSDVVAHKRVQIDTRKWMLSKMLPKVYGDRVTNEHTGADGGPIAVAAVDLKNLSDQDLENMQRLMLKARGAS